MNPWQANFWSTEINCVDDEHDRLHEMLAALSFVILNSTNQTLSLEALGVMRNRFNEHCKFEESIAVGSGLGMEDILQHDHAELLSLLEDARIGFCNSDISAARAAVERFTQDLMRHDEVVDLPLFRLISSSGVALAL